MASLVANPIPVWLDNTGAPLQGGKIYIGIANTDPTTNPVSVFQDEALSIPFPQPISVTNGMPTISGSPRQIFLSDAISVFSIAVFDSAGNMVQSLPYCEPASSTPGPGTKIRNEFIAANGDFVAGVTQSLTLSADPGSGENLSPMYFDAVPQFYPEDFTVSGRAVNFTSPILAGTTIVRAIWGATSPGLVPQAGSVTDASVAVAAGINTSKLSYTAPYAGAVARTQQGKNADIVSIADFGGSAGATAVVNTAAAIAAHATGLPVYYPPGTWNLNPFSIAAGGIVGAGQGATILSFADTSAADLVTYTGTGSSGSAVPVFGSFSIYGVLAKSSGSALRFNATSGELSFPYINNVGIQNVAGGIRFTNTGQFAICGGCNIVNYAASKGIWIENTDDPDFGDSAISDCFLNTSVPTGSTFGIWYRSSGGLKCTNVKVLGGDSCFVQGFNSASKNVANLLIANCSFENALQYGIFLGRDSGTFSFGTVKIANTEIGCAQGIATDGSGYMTLLNIDAHTINLTSSSGTGILLSNVANFRIGAGIINAQAGSGTTVGISTTSTCSNGKISPQTFVNIPPANRISNGSSSVIYEEISQTGGIGNVTTSTSQGSLYTGTVGVLFDEPFSVAPTSVTCNQPPTNGAVTCQATNITTTGFTAQVFGTANGGVTSGATYSTQGGVI